MKKKKKDIWKWDVLSFVACIITDSPSCLLVMPLSDIISCPFGKGEVLKPFFPASGDCRQGSDQASQHVQKAFG